MKILIIGLTIMALFQVSINLADAKPLELKPWMDTGWLVKNKYIRCNKIWYPPNHEPDSIKCFMKYYKPCKGGWCRK